MSRSRTSSEGAPGDKGFVLVVSGPSGTGKTSLCYKAMEHLPGLSFSVSYTTRPPRVGEVDGKDYFFVDGAAFEAMRDGGRLAEWATVHGNLYGTSLDFLTAHVDDGRCLILDIDTQGALQIRERYDNAVLVFILPPGPEVLRERLIRRGTDAPDVIERRLAHARGEMAQAPWYDYVIVNDDIERALAQLEAIITAEACRSARRAGTLSRILQTPPAGEP